MTNVPKPFDPPERLLLGPGPSPIDPRILQAFTRPTLGHLDPNFIELMDEVREMIRSTFKTTNDITFPVSGTGTSGMETCIINVVEPGDEVLSLVHGYFSARMAEIARRAGGNVRTLTAPWGEGFDSAQVEEELKKSKTDVLTVVHAETSTGYCQKLPAIIEAAHKVGTLVVVDAVTSLGGIPVEVDEWGIDAIYSATQKCLGGPPGLSPISLSPRGIAKRKKRTKPMGSWYYDIDLVCKYWGAERAYHHTAPINNVYALHESLRILLEEGLPARWKRHEEASRRFAVGAKALGLDFQVKEGSRLPQLNAMRLPEGVDDKGGRKKLLEDHSIEIGAGLGELAGKVWRIGLMGHGARFEVVDRLLAALKDVLTK